MSSESPHAITIKSEVIELCQLLKFEGLVSSGGQGKQVISEGKVIVNGETETRKRRQIRNGDKVEYRGLTYVVVGPTS